MKCLLAGSTPSLSVVGLQLWASCSLICTSVAKEYVLVLIEKSDAFFPSFFFFLPFFITCLKLFGVCCSRHKILNWMQGKAWLTVALPPINRINVSFRNIRRLGFVTLRVFVMYRNILAWLIVNCSRVYKARPTACLTYFHLRRTSVVCVLEDMVTCFPYVSIVSVKTLLFHDAYFIFFCNC